MKNLIASHKHTIYLKPGEVLVTRKPVLVYTVLGSCVAVTMHSASRGYGAICHAMLPDNAGRDNDLRYVDSALRQMYDKLSAFGVSSDLSVKLFGGAQVLNVNDWTSGRKTVGEQNVDRAFSVLDSLGLTVAARDTGGLWGRKLYFCTRSGDVYVRCIRSGQHSTGKDMTL